MGVEFARRPGEAGRREGRRGGGGGGGGRDGGGGGGFGGGFRNRRSPDRRSGGPIRGGPPVRTNFRLIVENLSSSVSWQVLADADN